MATQAQTQSHDAIVACHPINGAAERYLRVTPQGAAVWEADPVTATAFESMREATRAALRLPGSLRAFGLPRHVEIAFTRLAA